MNFFNPRHSVLGNNNDQSFICFIGIKIEGGILNSNLKNNQIMNVFDDFDRAFSFSFESYFIL